MNGTVTNSSAGLDNLVVELQANAGQVGVERASTVSPGQTATWQAIISGTVTAGTIRTAMLLAIPSSS